jgi:feruloyl esterase
MSSVQVYPEDFDGVLVGAPAFDFNRLNRGQIHTQSVFRRATAKDGFFDIAAHWSSIHDVVLKYCDALGDGIVDGVVIAGSAENDCKPDFKADLLCNSTSSGSLYGANPTQCLNETQIANLETLYQTTTLNDTFVYDRYLPSLERSPATLTGAAAKAIDWYELAILQFPAVNSSFNGYTDINLDTVLQGEALNPGGSNGFNTVR